MAITKRSSPERRASARRRGYTKAWEKAAKAFLEQHPLCAHRGADGCKTLARHVDHIVPHKGDRRLFWDPRNWQPLCHPCHSRKTLAEQRGEDPRRGVDVSGFPNDPEHSWWT